MSTADDASVVCPLCTNHAYQWMLDIHSNRCNHCDFQIFIGNLPKKVLCNDWNSVGCGCKLPPGYCVKCCTKLRQLPIDEPMVLYTIKIGTVENSTRIVGNR